MQYNEECRINGHSLTSSSGLLLVEEAFDAHLRGLLERLVHDLDLGDLAVVRELPVGVDADSLREVSDRLLVKAVLAESLLIEVDERNEFGGAVHHDRLPVFTYSWN